MLDQNFKSSLAIVWRIQPIVPGIVRILIRFAQIPGRSAEFALKVAREFSSLQTAPKLRGWLRFWRFFDEIDRVAPNFFFQNFRAVEKIFASQKNCRCALIKRPPPIGRGTKQNDFPGVLINRPPGMIIKSLGVHWIPQKSQQKHQLLQRDLLCISK